MSLKHFEIYVDQTRKRLCMNHAAGRSGREQEHIQAGMPVLDSPTGTELQLCSATSALAAGHPGEL